jgi:hypothetical protein
MYQFPRRRSGVDLVQAGSQLVRDRLKQAADLSATDFGYALLC